MSSAAPEMALKRAEELVQQGNTQNAIEILQEVILGRKTKQTQIQEKLITLLIDLCCQQFNIEALKDCLLAYRQLTQNLNPQGLETAVTYFRETTENAVNAVLQKDSNFIPAPLEDTMESINLLLPLDEGDINQKAFKFQ